MCQSRTVMFPRVPRYTDNTARVTLISHINTTCHYYDKTNFISKCISACVCLNVFHYYYMITISSSYKSCVYQCMVYQQSRGTVPTLDYRADDRSQQSTVGVCCENFHYRRNCLLILLSLSLSISLFLWIGYILCVQYYLASGMKTYINSRKALSFLQGWTVVIFNSYYTFLNPYRYNSKLD